MGDFREFRKAAVDRLHDALEAVKPTGVPKGALALPILVVFLWEVARLTLFGVFSMLRSMLVTACAFIATPFVSAYVFVDILLITSWFFRQILNKMSGEKK